MTRRPAESLRVALLSGAGVAFSWYEQALSTLSLPTHLQPGTRYEFRTPIAEPLHAMELKKNGLSVWPVDLTSDFVGFARVLDRLYVPLPRDRVTTIAMFDACASAYELLIDTERNIRNISRLLKIIKADRPNADKALRILDFGCGTGLSLEAVARHPDRSGFELLGLDASPHMRAIAERRGLQLVGKSHGQLYDGIFASYVLHGALDQQDIERIADWLSSGGVFAGNWLHGEDGDMQAFLRGLTSIRQGGGKILRDETLWPRDPVVVFRADEG